MKFLQNQIPLTIPLGLIFSVVSTFFGYFFYSEIRYSMEPFELWNRNYYLLLIAIVCGIAAIGMLLRFSWSRYCGLLGIGLLLIFFIEKNITEPPPESIIYIAIICWIFVPLLLFAWLLLNERVIHEFENKLNKDDFDLTDEDILDA